jgi:hypothetical protein
MALASCEQLVTFALLWFASLKAFGLQRTQAASRLCGLVQVVRLCSSMLQFGLTASVLMLCEHM